MSRRVARRVRIVLRVSALAVVTAATLVAVPQSAEAAPATVTSLAPSVLLYSSDAYRPEATATFLAHSSLRWAHDSGCADHEIAARGRVDTARLGDGGYHHSTASALPFCRHNSDSYSTADHTSPRTGTVSGEGFFLDLDNAQRHASGTDSGTNAPAYYDYAPHRYVTYWFFFAFNDAITSVADHEGDWERISIRLDASDRPTTIAYYAHSGYCTVAWASAPSYQSHPVAYSATGTHASYPTAGTHGLDKTNAGPRWNTGGDLRDVRTQPFYGYGGAWGEVGETKESTGPLGPSAYKAPAPTDWNRPC